MPRMTEPINLGSVAVAVVEKERLRRREENDIVFVLRPTVTLRCQMSDGYGFGKVFRVLLYHYNFLGISFQKCLVSARLEMDLLVRIGWASWASSISRQ